MINAWLSKKKGSTFFDLMTMSDFAYTVAVLENSYEVWDQEFKKRRCLRLTGRTTLRPKITLRKHPSTQTERARRQNIAILDGVK